MATIKTSISITWSETGGDSIKGSVTNTITQAGTKALGNVQNIGTASEAVTLGDVTGAKIVMFENRDDTHTIYVDTANPATTGAAIKLAPGQGTAFPTTIDAFYAIAVGAAADLGVTAFQQ